MWQRVRGRFTLVELLAVIAVIALLTVIPPR
jgi:prepilin-type N-terminal cleavage/methylation domain-containing protein